MNKLPTLALVIPCYNEEKVLPLTAPMFLTKIENSQAENKISSDSFILFINDGSSDHTWEIIQQLSEQNPRYRGVRLSRNQGHQKALLCGLMEARELCDITISLDCDGQDDMDAIDQMIDEYYNGAEIVYGVRDNRDSDSFFKRFSAQSFYRLMNKLGAEVIYNHADYRLVSSRVLKEFSNFKEVNIFLRGMFPLVGFKSTCVYYTRSERLAGKSHYPLSKMLSLAFDGITSLSIRPIRIITTIGISISAISFLLILYVFFSYFSNQTIPGWSSSLLAICLLGGIQLISLGVIGEYVGKIYLETKERPRYIISERTWEKK